MAYVGTGMTITGAAGVTAAEILSVSWSGMSREAIETSHHGSTTARSFIAGDLYDPGELSVEIALSPGTALDIDDAAATITVTHADTGAATWAANGFATGMEWTTPLEERPTATITYKLSGVVTVTP